MRVLWSSNSPFVGSGYGMQTAIAAKKLESMGHDIAIFAFYGLQGYKVDWGSIQIYPNNPGDWGITHAPMFYEDFKADILITLVDAWVLEGLSPKMNWCPWFPVDHNPVPPKVVQIIKSSPGIVKPIAMSKFGIEQMKKQNIDCYYIPHTVNCDLFKPMPEFNLMARQAYGWEDKFVIGTVGTNHTERKNWNAALKAVAKFEKFHPGEVVYYMHTNPLDARGINLDTLVKALDLQGVAKIPSQTQMAMGIEMERMARMYNVFDVFLLPSKGEGFGIPLIESQACFPSDTPVEALGVTNYHKRLYSGEMVEIEVGDTVIKSTSEHPFWTNNGWIPAGSLTTKHRLLYNESYAKERVSEIYSGRIGEIIPTLQKDAPTRSSQANGVKLGAGVLASATSRNTQDYRGATSTKMSRLNRGGMGLYRRTDRRRGDSFYPQDVFSEAETLFFNRQFLRNTDGVARAKNWNAFCEVARAEQQKESLPIQSRGDFISTILQSSCALLDNKKGAYAVDYRMVGDTPFPEQNRSFNRPPISHHPQYTHFEYQTIKAVRKYQVKELPVFNLTTLSSTYLANGYLVHNCGTPVITTNCTAQPELLGGGWLLKNLEPVWTAQNSWQFECDVDEIVSLLGKAYRAKKTKSMEYQKKKAREKALEYDEQKIYSELWPPVLADIEQRIKQPKNLEGMQPWRLNLIPHNCVPRKVLDLGCGVTQPYRKQLEAIGQYVGVDIKNGSKDVLVADAHNLPFEDGEFGFVWCSEMLEHVDNPKRVVEEAKRVGRHGVILFSTPANSFFRMDPEHKIVKDVDYTTVFTGDGLIVF